MVHRTFLCSFLIFICTCVQVSAQRSYNDYKKQLRSLKDGAYISKSFQFAEELTKSQEWDNALDLIDRGVKKARSMGSNTEAVVEINKAHLLARAFPKDDAYIKEIIESIDKGLSSRPPRNLIEKSVSVMEMVQYRVSATMDPLVEQKVRELKGMIVRLDRQLVAEAKESELKEFEEMGTEEAFEQMQLLKEERERLEDAQESLTKSVEENAELLNRRTAIINRMTDEQAKAEAKMQYNQRIIDSLRFMAQLDSINILNSQHLIKEQEAELQLKESELHLKTSQQRLYITLSVLGLLITGFLTWIIYSTRKTNKKLAAQKAEIEHEKERSEELLLNILPKFIAQELKEKSKVKTRMIDNCTVLFTDFINFTTISKQLSPRDLIQALDECFRAFDNIITKYNIEKIKTIGDSYMCAGGVPIPNNTHAIDAVNAAFEMVNFLDTWNNQREAKGLVRFDARIGIHSGPIIAGVVGAKKFAYDIWGDTVNVAARIESKSAAQKINISESTYQLIKNHYQCEKRGSISVKNMTDLEMYFVDHPINQAILN